MTDLASISLTSAWMLWGTAAASLPIVAHLLNRRTRRKIVFPTIRLLRESIASQSRLFRLRRWLLLILRCLAILLVVLAFTRPVWLEKDVPSPSAGKAAAVVLLLDTSASAAQQSDGVSLINSMRAVAGRVLDSLSEGADLVNLVYADSHPRAAFPQLSGNFAAVRQELARLAPTCDRANLPEALALAGQILRDHSGQRRVVVLSDMQRTNWAETSLTGPSGDLLPGGTRVTVVPVQLARAENAALSSPQVLPIQPIVNMPCQLTVHVHNYSPRDATVPVEATVDGRSVGSQRAALKAWEGADVAFEARVGSEGQHPVVFSIPADGLAVDNHAFLVVKAVQRVPVAVIGDDNPNQAGSSTYFLIRALAPHGDMSDNLEVRHLTGADVTYARIADAEAVLVGYVGRLGKDALLALYSYANQGGGVAIFCGEGPVAENLLAFNGQTKHGDLLPWVPGMQRDLAREGGLLYLSGGGKDGQTEPPRVEMLRDFDEPSRQALRQIRFTRVWSTGPLKPETIPILTFSDGTPAISARHVGAGKLIVANFSPALTCSDLGKYGSFVALAHSLVNYLRPRQVLSAPAVVGEPFRYMIGPEASGRGQAGGFSVLGPDDRECEATAGEASAGAGAGTVFQVQRPALSGFHKFMKARQTLAMAAVNVDPRESDLRRVDEALVLEHWKSDRVGLEIRNPSGEGPVIRVRGRPLWYFFVIAAMAALGAELTLLTIWKR